MFLADSRKKNGGFTLIELLVVIAIIGLLATLAVVSLNNARAKSRDAKRVSDIRQLQTALELYFSDNDIYPNNVATNLGVGSYQVLCDDGGDGWAELVADCGSGAVYMGKVPATPAGGGVAGYTYSRAGSGEDYVLTFELEQTTANLGPGVHTASAVGIR